MKEVRSLAVRDGWWEVHLAKGAEVICIGRDALNDLVMWMLVDPEEVSVERRSFKFVAEKEIICDNRARFLGMHVAEGRVRHFVMEVT